MRHDPVLSPALDLLKGAKEVLTTHHWRRGDLATDSLGQECGATSPEACQFCALGAIARAKHTDVGYFDEITDKDHRAAVLWLASVVPASYKHLAPGQAVWRFNDAQRDKPDVIEAFDKAIDKLTHELSKEQP